MEGISTEIIEMMKDDRDFRISFKQERLATAFLENVATRMEAVGMSKAALARAMGKSAAYVSKLMNKEQNLTIRTMVELADAVGMDPTLHLKPSAIRGRPASASGGPPSSPEGAPKPKPVADAQ